MAVMSKTARDRKQRNWNEKDKKLKTHKATPRRKARKMHGICESMSLQLDNQFNEFALAYSFPTLH